MYGGYAPQLYWHAPVHATRVPLCQLYSPECVEGKFCELRFNGVLGSWHPPPLESMMRSLREGIEPGRNARDSQRRVTGSAPGKQAKDATGCSLPFGRGYALLPRDLALLASDHHLRGAHCRCGGGRRSCGWRSVGCSGRVRKPPPYSSGRSQGGGQAPRERLSPDDATTGTRLLRGVRRMAAYDERSEAWSYLLLARRRSFVVGSVPCWTIPPWGLPALRGLPLRPCGVEYR